MPTGSVPLPTMQRPRVSAAKSRTAPTTHETGECAMVGPHELFPDMRSQKTQEGDYPVKRRDKRRQKRRKQHPFKSQPVHMHPESLCRVVAGSQRVEVPLPDKENNGHYGGDDCKYRYFLPVGPRHVPERPEDDCRKLNLIGKVLKEDRPGDEERGQGNTGQDHRLWGETTDA